MVLADILEDSVEVEVQQIIDNLLEDFIATEAKKSSEEMLAIGRDIMEEIVAGMSFPESQDATTDLVEKILHETITNAMEHSAEAHVGQVL